MRAFGYGGGEVPGRWLGGCLSVVVVGQCLESELGVDTWRRRESERTGFIGTVLLSGNGVSLSF
jgi:hypothetical protein